MIGQYENLLQKMESVPVYQVTVVLILKNVLIAKQLTINNIMKKFLVFIIGALLFVSCNTAPDIQKLTELTRPEVENLITEDNNDETYIRLDRYFLSEKPDDRTYIGSVKMTAFYKHTKWNFSTLMREEVVDSLKLYKEVIIKFTDNKYDYYTIHIE